MSETTIRIIAGLVILVHGIGHTMALFPALNIASTDKWHYRSWLLSNYLSDKASRGIVVVLFGISSIGFIIAGLGILGWLVPHDWWQTAAMVSAVISLVSLAIFWNAFASFIPNKIGSILVNLAIFWGLLGTNSLSSLIAGI